MARLCIWHSRLLDFSEYRAANFNKGNVQTVKIEKAKVERGKDYLMNKLVKPKITESQVQKSITDYLTAKGVLYFRLNSGQIRTQTGGFCRLAPKGTPDLLALPQRGNTDRWDATPIFIEVKRPGGKLSESQTTMHTQLKEDGFIVTVADDVKQVIELFAKLKI